MPVIERHVSPDGLLTLVVDRADDGDWAVGFEGLAWHTHGDCLASSGHSGSQQERVRAFVEDVIASRRVIVVLRVNGKICDAWVTDDPGHDEAKYAAANETIERRLWSGEPA